MILDLYHRLCACERRCGNVGEPKAMSTYSKWTARIALIAIGLTILAIPPAIPIQSTHHRTVWPLSRHFGGHHVIADVYLICAYGILAIVLLIGAACVVGSLFDRAGWGEK